jgi:DivIVA domain-containing protein
VPEDESSKADEGEPELSPSQQEPSFGELGHYVPADLLDVSFPAAVRGYDRGAVDDYTKRVNHAIAELKVHASPRAAVTHALEQTEQQVSGLLQRARETGEEITASARQEAEEIVAAAKGEAAKLIVNVSTEADGMKAEAEQLVANARTEAEDILLRSRLQAENDLARSRAEAEEHRQQVEEELAARRVEAETRMRELETDTETIRNERGLLLDDIRNRASGLLELANAAAAREGTEAEGEPLESEAVDDTERPGPEAGETTAEDGSGRVSRKRRQTGS